MSLRKAITAACGLFGIRIGLGFTTAVVAVQDAPYNETMVPRWPTADRNTGVGNHIQFPHLFSAPNPASNTYGDAGIWTWPQCLSDSEIAQYVEYRSSTPIGKDGFVLRAGHQNWAAAIFVNIIYAIVTRELMNQPVVNVYANYCPHMSTSEHHLRTCTDERKWNDVTCPEAALQSGNCDQFPRCSVDTSVETWSQSPGTLKFEEFCTAAGNCKWAGDTGYWGQLRVLMSSPEHLKNMTAKSPSEGGPGKDYVEQQIVAGKFADFYRSHRDLSADDVLNDMMPIGKYDAEIQAAAGGAPMGAACAAHLGSIYENKRPGSKYYGKKFMYCNSKGRLIPPQCQTQDLILAPGDATRTKVGSTHIGFVTDESQDFYDSTKCKEIFHPFIGWSSGWIETMIVGQEMPYVIKYPGIVYGTAVNFLRDPSFALNNTAPGPNTNPFMYFWWTPDGSAIPEIDASQWYPHHVAFPPFVKADCGTNMDVENGKGCDGEITSIAKLYSNRLSIKSPGAEYVLRNMKITIDELKATFKNQLASSGKYVAPNNGFMDYSYGEACDYVKNNLATIINQWLPHCKVGNLDPITNECNCPTSHYLKRTSTVFGECAPCTELGPNLIQGPTKVTCVQKCDAGSYYSTELQKLIDAGAVEAPAKPCKLADPGFEVPQAGSLFQQPCPDGTISTSPGTVSCTVCSPGTYQAKGDNTKCVPCAINTKQPSEKGTYCLPCDAGTNTQRVIYTDGTNSGDIVVGVVDETNKILASYGSDFLTAQSKCSACEKGYTYMALDQKCHKCTDFGPHLTTIAGISQGVRDCVCDRDTYFNFVTGKCEFCPQGFNCPDPGFTSYKSPTLIKELGAATFNENSLALADVSMVLKRQNEKLPSLQPQYMSEPGETAILSWKCKNSKVCPGGTHQKKLSGGGFSTALPGDYTGVCARNRIGKACGMCADNHYPDTSSGECIECAGTNRLFGFLIMIGGLVGFCLGHQYFAFQLSTAKSGGFLLTFHSFALFLTYMQLFRCIKRLHDTWPAFFDDFFTIVSVVGIGSSERKKFGF